ncbi:MAG: hypothetical protein WDM86_19505 [Rhizomicrobium sp.]
MITLSPPLNMASASGVSELETAVRSLEVAGADAAHHDAGRGAAARGQRLAVDDRRDVDHARHRAHAGGDRVETRQVAAITLDDEMTLQAQDARQQVVTKAVHHRHDDDERGDGERDPGQRQDRNERNEPVLAPRPQVAKRDHPLEAGEGAASGGAGRWWRRRPGMDERRQLGRRDRGAGGHARLDVCGVIGHQAASFSL